MDKHFELVPVKPVDKPKRDEPVIIKPSDLEDYLFTPGIEINAVLPSSFNFSSYSHHLKELYDFSHEDFIFEQPQAQTPNGTTDNSVVEQSNSGDANANDLLSIKASTERGRVLFFDTKTEKTGVTDITAGKFRELFLPFVELYKEGKIPGIFLHTHPSLSMLSSDDYRKLLVDYIGDGTRVLKGVMALCPDIQILALTTDKTPHLSWDQTSELIMKYNSAIENYVQRGLEILNNYQLKKVLKPLEIAKEHSERRITLLQRFADGEINMNEYDKQVEVIDQELDAMKKDGSLSLSSEELEKILRRIDRVLIPFINATLMGFARDTHMKLYSSTDMKTFKEFSA